MNSQIFDKEERKKADDELIKNLLVQGADLNKVHKIDFTFIGSKEKLQSLLATLENQGFSKMEESTENRLVVVQEMKLELMHDHMIAESLDSIASQLGVDFDGWGTIAVN